jgi:hypothetical protein
MNCDEVRQMVLDSLIGPIRAEFYVLMETHIAGCDACRRFADVQRALDTRLTAVVPVVTLSSGFRSSLRQRISSRQISIWPEFLPDVAHLIGCVFGVVLLLLLFPGHSRSVLLAGAGFTAVTYFLQAVLRSSLERLEPRL